VRTRRGTALLTIVAGAVLLGGCRGGSGPAAAPTPTVSSPAPASVAAAPRSTAPRSTVAGSTAAGSTAAGSTTAGSGTARLDEVDATLDRIERELDSDGGR
jgi:hypothetical protein